ncbi:hypothetical protein Nepgr_020228 [Nepenthes gracilis]|uniref:Uncharacterized protein n=1 Tax=Nepenthes gracilis TaxID=150966 RepID=A0AAD3XUU0_NEPGR|nr:hypothetical protein Nepgr_020228 [Nepenthes gracilis]
MRRRVNFWIRRLFPCHVSRPGTPQAPSDVDVREEYANAFRTESYYQFWARILELTHNDAATRRSMDSTSAARLPSYRLFAEHLLDPDQPTVTQLLSLTQIRPENQILLSDYFSETANASLLCGVLLKDIEKVRAKYQSLKKTIESLEYLASGCVNPKPVILTRLSEFAKSVNPFVPSSSSLTRFRAVQEICSGLLRRLEQGRDRAEAKLWLLNGLKRGSAIFLVALTVSVAVIAVSHALVMVVAMPALMVASPELASASKLAKMSAQLDAAAKGTYILNRDLDTISRLLSRLYDEVEHARAMIEFWLGLRGIYRVQASGEVARHLKKNDSSFCDQLDELEEHLYLCFMTINRARNLVVKEILGVGPISVTSP